MSKSIVIAERDNIAAVLEQGRVEEFFIQRGEVLLNDVYLGSVENILPSIDAAFLNVGCDKMGFLHASDIMGNKPLEQKVKHKDKMIVQVIKEPTSNKGPRLTTSISLPGRFLVLMPNETGINISEKIANPKERARLKSIVSLIKPTGVGVIVRTEAEGQSDSDIQDDLELLLEKWSNIIYQAESAEPPTLLHRDQDLLYKVLREACTEDVSNIIVDTAFALNRTQLLMSNWNMGKNINISLHKGNESLLVATGIVKEIKAALQTKVNLPSGGYLFIQTTEALTVVDVNSGKFVSSATQDETIFKTNIEAIHEIARQLKLRNIGGMIIIDFIDMTKRADKLAMLEELELALESDKAKPQVGQLSDLGLVELTRHRQGQALFEIFTKKCPHCQGLGYQFDELTVSSPVAEGEYRAKAAKLKLPTFNKKFDNRNQGQKNFNNQNHQQNNHQQNQLKIDVQQQRPQGNLLQQQNIKQVENKVVEKVEKIVDNVEKVEKNEVVEISENKKAPKTSKKPLKQDKKVDRKETIEKIDVVAEVAEVAEVLEPVTKKRGRKPSKAKKGDEVAKVEKAQQVEEKAEIVEDAKPKKRLPRKAKKAKNDEK